MALHFLGSPYNLRESAGWVFRNIFGLGRNNAGIVHPLSSPFIFNKTEKIVLRLAFIGDIMETGENDVEFDPRLKAFVEGCDYLAGNFEGVITGKKKSFLKLEERHDRRITRILSSFFPPARTILSLANNHACDFGMEACLESEGILKEAGFNTFGLKERPFIDIGRARIAGGTMWTNRRSDYIAMLDGAEKHAREGAFNLLYPHFGYELELYPRPEIVRMARRQARVFDAVVGGHSHWPQALTREEAGGGMRLVAYSLGTFCGIENSEMYRHGIILKLEIGEGEDGRLLLGRAEWNGIYCSKEPCQRLRISLM